MIKLYKKGAHNMHYWFIWENVCGFSIEYGVIGGSPRYTDELVEEGKAGREQCEQVDLMIASRVKKKMDAGYKSAVEEAEKGVFNQLGFLMPMLAKPIKGVRDIDWDNAHLQMKYDGHRCLITMHNGLIIAYSRNGKPIHSIPHIIAGITIREGQTLDGELYCHGQSLQQIASWIKRKQPNSAKLRYHVYDVISDEPYSDRLDFLCNMNISPSIIVAPTRSVSSLGDVMNDFDAAIKLGYEGLILRHGDTGYETNKRSNSLIKIKKFLDDEFKVVAITAAKDGWAILTCLAKNDRTFRVSAPGDFDQKMLPLLNQGKYIGRCVSVKFSELTKDGIPFHPVATKWRNKDEE